MWDPNIMNINPSMNENGFSRLKIIGISVLPSLILISSIFILNQKIVKDNFMTMMLNLALLGMWSLSLISLLLTRSIKITKNAYLFQIRYINIIFILSSFMTTIINEIFWENFSILLFNLVISSLLSPIFLVMYWIEIRDQI